MVHSADSRIVQTQNNGEKRIPILEIFAAVKFKILTLCYKPMSRGFSCWITTDPNFNLIPNREPPMLRDGVTWAYKIFILCVANETSQFYLARNDKIKKKNHKCFYNAEYRAICHGLLKCSWRRLSRKKFLLRGNLDKFLHKLNPFR